MSKFRRIDIHAHVNFSAFDADRDAVIARALDSGTAMINVGTQIDTSRAAVELTRKYPEGVYAIVGLHPIHTSASFHDEKELGPGGKEFTSRGEEFDPALYRELLKDPKAVGIGECGLDYYRLDESTKAKQKETFRKVIVLAHETGKPLMLHIRPSEKSGDAYDDALDMLASESKNGRAVKGDSHFFAGTTAQARRFLDLGITLSFTGVITFAKQYLELVEYVPLDMIQAETDCPFVAPVPYRGKRNEPAYVSEVVAKIARVKNLPLEEVENALLANGRRVWGVGV